jgi:hypothetical protein
VGSNPTRSIESPVQIPESYNRQKNPSIVSSKTEIAYMQIPTQTDYKMRDLYNRDNKLEYRLNRINADLDELDKTDLLCLGRYCKIRRDHIMDC